MQQYEQEFFDQLVYNAIRTPDGFILDSTHVHDFVEHTDQDGSYYANDGGLSYQRRMFSKGARPTKDISVIVGDSHDKVREVLFWGTYGKEGTDSFKRVTLAEMSTEHIKAIIKDCTIDPWREAVYNREIQDREEGKYENIYD